MVVMVHNVGSDDDGDDNDTVVVSAREEEIRGGDGDGSDGSS